MQAADGEPHDRKKADASAHHEARGIYRPAEMALEAGQALVETEFHD